MFQQRAPGIYMYISPKVILQGQRKSLTHQQDWYVLLSAKRSKMSTARDLQDDLRQAIVVIVYDQKISSRLHEGGPWTGCPLGPVLTAQRH